MDELSNIIKSYREKKGISLKELSDKTKIRKNILSAIEEGDFSVLPPVYGISFLKTIVITLEIPEEEYSQYFSPIQKKEKEQVQKKQSAPIKDYGSIKGSVKIFGIELNPNFMNYALYFAFGLLVLILLYISLFYEKDLPDEPQLDVQTELVPDDEQIIITNDDIEDETFLPDSISLKVVAIDTAWVRIDMDGQRSDEVLFVPKQTKVWKAKEYFIIYQGNYGALEYSRNGKVLEPFGSPGSTIRNVKITKDKVVTPTPW
jgi:cytoskeletal protein RodZ